MTTFVQQMDLAGINWWDKEMSDGQVKFGNSSPMIGDVFPVSAKDEQGLPEPYDVREVIKLVHPNIATLVGVASQAQVFGGVGICYYLPVN